VVQEILNALLQSEVKLNMENINSWKDIQWTTIENKIFRLQLRIYKAATNQQFEKMYKLQKLLISSKSAKYLSVRKVTQDNSGKKSPGVDQKIYTTPNEKFVLANELKLDGKSSPIRRVYIPSGPDKQRPLSIPTIKDRAKQMLVYLALCPQWEAQFEKSSYGFRPGRSVLDAVEAVFLGISKKPKWVLDADISKCFDRINYQYLLDKCNTYPEMQKQIRSWLKAGILYSEDFAFPEMGTPQGGIISPLLANIAMHGLRESLDKHINSLGGHRPNNRQALTYVRYADDFVLMHPDKKVLEQLKEVTQDFLKPIGLELHPTKTRIVHTLEGTEESPPGFTFLGFDIIQQRKWIRMRKAITNRTSNQTFITLITPSKESIKKHKLKVREMVRSYNGASQTRLIQKLNPIIRGWALSKRTQISSKVFQALDQYVYLHLWKWARKRHPKMSKYKLKEKYWHIVGSRNWVFGVKDKKREISFQLQLHSKIPIQRHAKVKGTNSPFDGNLIYWATRSGRSPLIPPIKARLIKEQKGRCGICRNFFLPDDVIERDHIIPKALGGKNIRENVHAVHRYCHLNKTKFETAEIRRNRN
jgi:RNA-directed DNA polymerase